MASNAPVSRRRPMPYERRFSGKVAQANGETFCATGSRRTSRPIRGARACRSSCTARCWVAIDAIGDGVLGGFYARPDDEVLRIWRTGVEEIRGRLERWN